MKIRNFGNRYVWLVWIILLVLQILHSIGTVRRNYTLLLLLYASRNMDGLPREFNMEILRDQCQSRWIIGKFNHLISKEREAEKYFLGALSCNIKYLTAIRYLLPENKVIASYSVQYYPNHAESYFWLADIVSEQNMGEAADLYESGLELSMESGDNWYKLGNIYEALGEYNNAIDSFIEASKFLNAGSDCLVRVGRIYEMLGNFDKAIYYYRLSIFTGAHERANWLEANIKP